MTLTATIKASIAGSHTSALDLGTAEMPFNVAKAIALASGVGADQCDVLFSDTRTLAASATENLDVAGALTNAFGTAVFARVKAILVIADAGNINDVQVTRPASNGLPFFMAAGDGFSVGPGDVMLLTRRSAAGWVVTAGTGDLITVTNSAGSTSVTYSIVVLGASA